MEEEVNKRGLIFCGDVHGYFEKLVWTITVRYKIKNSSVVVCGDFGVGFESKKHLNNLYKHCKKRLEESDITIYVARGNHDDPDYFKNPEKYNYERLKFLEDHKVYNIENKKVYVIGGANSVDYRWRIDWNNEPSHKERNKKVWWEDEDVVKLPIEKLSTNTVDIIVSHEAPLSFSPIISRPEGLDTFQYNKILECRNYLNDILKTMSTKYWFYGHYHTSYSGSYNNTIYKCLDELELFEIVDKEEIEDNNN